MNLSRVVKLVFVLIVIAIAVMLYPPLRLSALVLAGRSPVCPLRRQFMLKRIRSIRSRSKTRF